MKYILIKALISSGDDFAVSCNTITNQLYLSNNRAYNDSLVAVVEIQN